METAMKPLLAIIFGIIVLVAVVMLLTNVSKNVPKQTKAQELFQRGCNILAKNGCNFDIYVDGKNFTEVIQELGYSKETVKNQCCISE